MLRNITYSFRAGIKLQVSDLGHHASGLIVDANIDRLVRLEQLHEPHPAPAVPPRDRLPLLAVLAQEGPEPDQARRDDDVRKGDLVTHEEELILLPARLEPLCEGREGLLEAHPRLRVLLASFRRKLRERLPEPLRACALKVFAAARRELEGRRGQEEREDVRARDRSEDVLEGGQERVGLGWDDPRRVGVGLVEVARDGGGLGDGALGVRVVDRGERERGLREGVGLGYVDLLAEGGDVRVLDPDGLVRDAFEVEAVPRADNVGMSRG